MTAADYKRAYQQGYSDGQRDLRKELDPQERTNKILCTIKTVTNAKEAEEYPISEDIKKGFEEFTRMIFKQGEGIKMYKEIGLVTVKKSADYYNKLVRAVEDAGFILILTTETYTDRYYIVAEKED